jgi:hypothetical protein
MATLITEELAKQLIEHYTNCINEIEKSPNINDAISICIRYATELGICKAATLLTEEYIYGCEWIKNLATVNINGSLYATHIPVLCDTIPEIITALQTRVDMLLTFKTEK